MGKLRISYLILSFRIKEKKKISDNRIGKGIKSQHLYLKSINKQT